MEKHKKRKHPELVEDRPKKRKPDSSSGNTAFARASTDNLTKNQISDTRESNHPPRRPVKLWRPWITDEALETEAADDDPQTQNAPSETLDDIQKLIEDNASQIRDYTRLSKGLQDRFNFQTQNPGLMDLRNFLEVIFRSETTVFKLNVSCGFILRHIKTDQLVFYYASNNNKLLGKPKQITKREDLEAFVTAFVSSDLLEYCRSQRPNTRFVVETITNMLFYADKIKNFRIGGRVVLPEWLTRNRTIVALSKDRHGNPYNDNCCIFRCLAVHRGEADSMNENLDALLYQWCQYVGQTHRGARQFKGISINQLPDFEQCFRVDVEVYSLCVEEPDADGDADGDDPGPTYSVQTRYSSLKRNGGTMMNLNLYQDHFSYIKQLNQYIGRWKCCKCEKLFPHKFRLVNHERNCTGTTCYRFSGGGYGLRKTIFDELAEEGFRVENDDRFYEFRITIDFEAVLEETYERPDLLRKLIPLSVGVCSNVPGFVSPTCMVSRTGPQDLMRRLFDYLFAIAEVAYERTRARLAHLLQQIESRQDQYDAIADEDERLGKAQNLDKLSKKLDHWMKQIVVLGFNSGRFDLNLVRSYIFPYLLENGISINYIIKKGNNYLSVALEKLLFLDIRNYLSPTVSYDAWLESYNISTRKGYFPYEWMDRVEKLDYPELPPKAAFFSTLKQKGIGDDKYANLVKVWKDEDFNTMEDMLVWYNKLEVEPFVEAAQKLFDHWKTQGIDAFKGRSISLPGIALEHLVNTLPSHVILPVIPEQHKDLHFLLQSNIVGGLTVVMHRYHEVNLTKLPNGALCKSISSRDANSLYLASLADETGTGLFGIWRSRDEASLALVSVKTHNEMTHREIADWEAQVNRNLSISFGRRSAYPHRQKEIQWLEWKSLETGLKIQHQFNGGQKTVIRSSKVRYPVDGYEPLSKTVYQFHGCHWHGHGCEKDSGRFRDRRAQTEEISQNLRDSGYSVTEIWECEWDEMVAKSHRIRQFLSDHMNLPIRETRLTGEELLRRVADGRFFGLIECDIEVPLFSRQLVDKFAEFPPIYKNAMINIGDIGEHMESYCRQNQFLNAPRRCLINSYFGVKILLSSSLIRWYMEHGLRVTRIYQLIEMVPKRCFTHLRDEVADKRRKADKNPLYKASGQCWKYVGNHYYGKTCTNKEKHKVTKIQGSKDAVHSINDKRFCECDVINEDAYEPSMDRKVINFDLPISIAVFVYMNSKLRMLKFIYDFLQRYLNPGSYQLVCSDTDSIIAAYADTNIDNLVKPQLRDEYDEFGKKAYLVTDTYSKRTPGLFKIEWEGTGIVALCAKTYCFWNENETKVSSKGLSKVTNDFRKEDYLRVLETGVRGQGTNFGFKRFAGHLHQYRQVRRGLSYLYVKRKVLQDGVSTEPLDL